MSKDPLSVSHPELARQAVGWDPSTVTFGSTKDLAWRCDLGHEYVARPNNRSHGSDCPVCSGKKVLAGFNDLATTHPALASEIAVGDGTRVSAGSHARLVWRCREGHTWTEKVAHRVRGYCCPYCSGQRVLPGFNDLSTTHPEVAAEAVGWDPTTVSKGSNTERTWQCPLEHHYKASPNKRTSGRGCPYCSGNRVLPEFNDLASRFPAIAAQAVDVDPTTITAGSNSKVLWRCQNGHEWPDSVKNRTHGRSCPKCGQHRVYTGINDLASVRPDLAAEARGWDPTAVSAKDDRPRPWRCAEGHEWEVAPRRRSAGSDCPYCSGTRVIPGVNDLKTVHPHVAAQAVGWDPSLVHAGSWARARWNCEMGHEWFSAIGDRVKGYGCPTCAGRRVLAGFNDLATTHPELAAQADGWDPRTVSKGHVNKLAWICPDVDSHRWEAPPNTRSRGVGCPYCADYGFNAACPGWLYLLEHKAWGLLKVGITNVPPVRMRILGRSNWVRRDIAGPFRGDLVRGWEQRILRALGDKGVRLGPREIAGNFDGVTECWIEAEFPVETVQELLDLIDCRTTRSESKEPT